MIGQATPLEVTRPALRWHGGKWMLAPWIIGHFPKHRTYVEPYGGAASVLIRKDRSYSEVYNDLCDEVVDFFRVLRDPEQSAELIRRVSLTPFARCEFERAYEHTDDTLERSRRLIIRSFMGFGSDGHNKLVKTGFRSNSDRSGTTPAHDWMNLPDGLKAVAERFSGVIIENRPAIQVMATHDGEDTLHYVDPPYLPSTRSTKSRRGKIRYHAYTHEMTTEDHETMLRALLGLKGMVVLSGYPSPLYQGFLGEWHRVERVALADGARKRVESLWINPQAYRRLIAQGSTVAQKHFFEQPRGEAPWRA